MDIFNTINHLLMHFMRLISSLGYSGIIIVVGLEYACFPIPSEVLLPFVGFATAKGDFKFAGALFASVIGGICGCVLCYSIGYFGGRPVLDFVTRKVPSSVKPISAAKSWFSRYDKTSVIITRLFPLARTYISIPAGIAKMNIIVFILYSTVGIFIWNTILVSLGYFLGNNWSEVEVIMEEYTIIAVIFALVFLLLYIIIRHLKKR